jgi:hypothetical protein
VEQRWRESREREGNQQSTERENARWLSLASRGLVEREKSGRRVADVCRDVLVRQSDLIFGMWGMSKEDKWI